MAPHEPKIFAEKYHDLMMTCPDAIFVVERKSGKILEVNDAVCDLLGYSSEEILGTDAGSRVVPSQKNAFRREFANHRRIGRFSGEFKLKRKDGSIVIVEVNGSASGDILFAFARDITERKRAEAALIESKEEFRSLAEKSPNMIFINNKGRVVYANHKCEELMGYKRKEFYSPDFDFLNLIAPESRKLVKANFIRHMKGEEIPPYEYTLLTKKGMRIEGIHTTTLINYEGERAILGIITDITKRKQAEDALRESEKELSNLLDISRNITTTIKLDELLDVAVKETVDATGMDRVSVVLLDEGGKGRVQAAYTKMGEKIGVGNVIDLDKLKRQKEALKKKKPVYVKNALNPKTQSRAEIELAKRLNIRSGVHLPLIFRDKVVGLLNFASFGKARGFTKREIEFYQAIANQLAAMIANAQLYEESNRAHREAEFYVDLMGHDINNTNTVAIGMLELLAKNADLGDLRNYVQRAIMAIERSVSLIDNVRKLQLAKSDGTSGFEKRNLYTILEEVIMDVKNFHRDRVVKVNFTHGEALIYTDALVRDLFWNLLDNAAKYDPHKNVEIDVEVKDEAGEWLVKVNDRGRGIPDDLKTVIFERFKRFDSGTRGSGVGLHLCKLLTDKYGGRIWVENRVRGDHKKGSVFHVTLPKV